MFCSNFSSVFLVVFNFLFLKIEFFLFCFDIQHIVVGYFFRKVSDDGEKLTKQQKNKKHFRFSQQTFSGGFIGMI